jgi:acetyl-CoA carboxylase biotin carboxyl carrier protein
MTIEEIKELIQAVKDSGIAELEVARGDNRVCIRRGTAGANPEILAPAAVFTPPAGAPAAAHAAAAAADPSQPAAPVPPGPVEDERTVYVKSPIVGTFYESASPGSPAFVKPGDPVSVGQVLCIIESMKLMNEIESDVAGTVIARLVENGRPVEYGESLFAIQPA